jgi:hypothetical protein
MSVYSKLVELPNTICNFKDKLKNRLEDIFHYGEWRYFVVKGCMKLVNISNPNKDEHLSLFLHRVADYYAKNPLHDWEDCNTL